LITREFNAACAVELEFGSSSVIQLGERASKRLSCFESRESFVLKEVILSKRISLSLSLSSIFFAITFTTAYAEHGHDANVSSSADAADYASLPDAPQPSDTPASPANVKSTVPGVARTKPASRFATVIEPDESTKVLTVKEKFQYSFIEQVSPFAVGSYLLSAGWEQLLDSDPKYPPNNAEAFGKRLGISVVRQSSQAVFTDGVFASLFHQDPRYYRMGGNDLSNFWPRAGYVCARVLTRRQDSGKIAPNYSLLLGYAAASALTMAYYPSISATWPKTWEGYGYSVLANAGGNAVHEFWPDAKRILFHRHD
jgi:hypothetical protein